MWLKNRINIAFTPFIILLSLAVIYSISAMDAGYRQISDGPLLGEQEIETSPILPAAMGFIKFFQEYVSPGDGPRCALYPTCSEYGLQALKKHGLMRGLVMTFDRLLHEPDERRMKQALFIRGSYRVPDPLSENELSPSKQ